MHPGEDQYMKGVGMFVVSLMGVKFRILVLLRGKCHDVAHM